MDTIGSLRTKILGHLRSIGLVKSYGAGNIQDLNQYADSWAVVKACLVAGLYPNICRVDKENATIKTRIDKKISPHPSSVIRDKSLKKNKESILSLPSEWIVFEEKTRAGIHCLIKCNTVVTPATVAMFCGPLFLPTEDESLIPWKELDECNSDNDEHDMSDKSKLIVDDWINFAVDTTFGHSIFHFRHKLSALFLKFISNPRAYQPNANEQYLLNSVARLLEEEDRHLGFAGHNNIGQKPRPVIQTHQNNNAAAAAATASSTLNFSFPFSRQQQQQQQSQQHGWNRNQGRNQSQNQNQNNNNQNKPKQRFFVVHAASVEAVQKAGGDLKGTAAAATGQQQDGAGWNWHPKLTKMLRKSPNLNMTLFFHISQCKCFYGAGRLTLAAGNRAHLNLFSRNTVPFDTLSSFEKSYLRGRVVEEYLDGEELSPQSGRELMEFFK